MSESLTGNDILDLKDPFNISSFSNPRYLEKVMTKMELKQISNSINPCLAQIFWTAKESVYKLRVKEGLRVRFNPIDFDVTSREDEGQIIDSTVRYHKAIYYSRSSVNEKYIHTVASETKSFGASRIWLAEHETLERQLSIELGEQMASLSIQRDFETGIPSVIINSTNSSLDLSLTHDGEYAALAIG